MKDDRAFHVGEFLFRYYRKRTKSFLANIYKAGITGSSRDIHRARLDAKKMIAMLDLLRIMRRKKIKQALYEITPLTLKKKINRYIHFKMSALPSCKD